MTQEQNLLGKAIGGTYHVLRLLGEGGMARVYEAAHLPTGQRVAVKVLHHRHVTHRKVFARFQREARIIGSLEHPNIAKLLGTGTTSTDLPYIVMEFLEGQTLRQAINKDGPLSVGRVAHILSQTLSALQAAHDAHVIHRDLKPDNIYLTNDGECEDGVKLLDFGVSKLVLGGDMEVSPLTDTGSVVGTASYMSPEQAVGAKNVSSRSDIYSMGVILYRALTGCFPFEAANHNALLLKILIEDPPDPRGINPRIPIEMAEIIRVAMDRNPAKRFEACEDFRARLLPFVLTSKPRVKNDSASVGPRATPEERQVNRIYEAIFVRVGTSSMDVALEDGNVLKILTLDDEQDLPKLLQDFFPCGIVSSVKIDPRELINRFPTLRCPLILIDLHETHRELAVHEWDPEHNGYAVRRAPITALDSEVNAFCKQRNESHFAQGELKSIGFNDNVKCANGTFHVATEVVARDVLKISTKIWNGGRIVDSIAQVLHPVGGDSLVQVSKRAEAQHTTSVDEVLRGRYSSDD